MTGTPGPVRFAEVAACLAVAQDHCFGQPAGSQQRSCLVALGLSDALGLSHAERATVYWTALLRFLGCTGHAHEVAVVFGDDIVTRARSFEWDPANPVELARELVVHGASQHRGLRRARAVLALMAGGRRGAELNFRTGCEVADELARRLHAPDPVRQALAHSFERWNGSGYPNRVQGEAIPVAARVALIAQELEVLARVHGSEEGTSILRRRAGRSYDPAIVAVVTRSGAELIAALDGVDPWDETLAVDPDPVRVLTGRTLDDALEVLADFTDLKSPYTAGHSRGVADLAEATARALGLPFDDQVPLRRAGLLHDLGRSAISNAVWDKPGPLTRDERDDVETHVLRSEQLVRRVAGFGPYLSLVGHHHERADGAGYHRRTPAAGLPVGCRILAAADCYQALTQPRAHRPALTPAQAAIELRSAVKRGHLDPTAADGVLAAAGHVAASRSATGPAGLTAREVQVIDLLARGSTTRQIAAALTISPKTADSHIQHIYTKIGVSTRGAAALYAMRHGLLSAGLSGVG